jgi:hypothetical protein
MGFDWILSEIHEYEGLPAGTEKCCPQRFRETARCNVDKQGGMDFGWF